MLYNFDGHYTEQVTTTDDTKMASKVDTVEDEEIVNDDLEALQNCTITNGMKFNVDKCSVMHCRRLNRNIDYQLYIQKQCVTESEKRLRSDNK